MDFENVKELIKTIDNSGITEFELDIGDTRIRISKSAKAVVVPVKTEAEPNVIFKYTPEELMTPDSQAEAEPAKAEAKRGNDGHVIKAPIVGTFYDKPSADSESYVKIGDKVSEGDTLCILEAMKVMNEIKSDRAGVISEIYAQNENMVEYGQPLFCII